MFRHQNEEVFVNYKLLYLYIFPIISSLDAIMSCDDIEEIVTTSHQQSSQTEDIDAKLTIWEPKVLSFQQNLSKSFT